MKAKTIYHRLRRGAQATHTVPRFEGRESRHHKSVPVWRLLAEASAHALMARRRLTDVETFVQFAGFPRSGHSLIGSILDAHPQARVSHELDAMSLLHQGMPLSAIFALIDRHALEFTRHGRCWNGFSYLVPGGAHTSVDPLRVLGDKKGDQAVRRVARAPGLLDRLNRRPRPAKKWILVLRNPFDNIATMSLRKGRAYDELRTSVAAADFDAELRACQAEGRIADVALDSEIEDYATLCRTVADIKHRTAPAHWFELSHEALTANPEATIRSMLAFLDLPAEESYVQACSGLVQRTPNRSRDRLDWPEDKHARVAALTREFSFLNRYDEP